MRCFSSIKIFLKYPNILLDVTYYSSNIRIMAMDFQNNIYWMMNFLQHGWIWWACFCLSSNEIMCWSMKWNGRRKLSFYASYNCVPSNKLHKYFCVVGQLHSFVFLSIYKCSYTLESGRMWFFWCIKRNTYFRLKEIPWRTWHKWWKISAFVYFRGIVKITVFL